MNALERIIHSHISQNGPMRLSDFMAFALSHPQHGYYMTRDPFGKAGDFITAPEMSQMFGEILGAWLIDIWQKIDFPEKVILLECGPGRGTLMADIMRVGQNVGFSDAAQVHLLETSPILRERQKKLLEDHDPTWHDTLDSVPNDAPILIVANEFFDALPVQQFIFEKGQWFERVIGVEEGHLVFGLKDSDPAQGLSEGKNGDVFEVSSVSLSLMQEIAKRITEQGGAGLFIDYGYDAPSFGDTVQAVKAHEYSNILENIGESDITAHVDFLALKKAVQGASVKGPIPQGRFLKNLGMGIRAQHLSQKADNNQKDDIEKAFKRLTSIDEMGQLFKVMAVTQEGIRPEGFE